MDVSTKADARTRGGWLRLTDAALLKQCDEERYRASGPGGQRRNKVETAVRLRHRPSGAVAHAEDSRALQENRIRAVRRLREHIAREVRVPFDLETPALPPELTRYRRDGALSINERNPAYPIVVAVALDALAAAEGSYAKAAKALGLTTSQLMKFLRRDPQVWRAASLLRERV